MKKKKRTTKSKINQVLRRLFMYSPEKREALAFARVRKGMYLCNECKQIFAGYKKIDGKRKCVVEVDHIVPFAKCDDWNKKLERLFDVNNLQVICKECHKNKTNKKNSHSQS